MQGSCADAKCSIQFDEEWRRTDTGHKSATHVWGAAPIACKRAGEIVWVRADETGGVDFMCLPDDGLPMREK
jgi:hypothetical protein